MGGTSGVAGAETIPGQVAADWAAFAQGFLRGGPTIFQQIDLYLRCDPLV